MLAQNFKTAADLQLSNAEFEALVKVLGMLERNEIPHHSDNSSIDRFDMGTWYSDACGTAGCIAGWAHHISGRAVFKFVSGFGGPTTDGLETLFCPFPCSAFDSASAASRAFRNIQPEQAAIALRNYLTSGEPRWSEALTE